MTLLIVLNVVAAAIGMCVMAYNVGWMSGFRDGMK